MPQYVYGCDECRIAVEKNHGMTDKPRYACPKCGGILHSLPGKKGVQFLKRTEELLTQAQADGHVHNASGSCCWHRVDEIIAGDSHAND